MKQRKPSDLQEEVARGRLRLGNSWNGAGIDSGRWRVVCGTASKRLVDSERVAPLFRCADSELRLGIDAYPEREGKDMSDSRAHACLLACHLTIADDLGQQA